MCSYIIYYAYIKCVQKKVMHVKYNLKMSDLFHLNVFIRDALVIHI